MSYAAYDPTSRDFFGDVASIGGLDSFRTFAQDKSRVIREFLDAGATADPEELARELGALKSDDPHVDDVRQNLERAAKQAKGALVLSDGTEDDLEGLVDA